jgi:hypothetical protein
MPEAGPGDCHQDGGCRRAARRAMTSDRRHHRLGGRRACHQLERFQDERRNSATKQKIANMILFESQITS